MTGGYKFDADGLQEVINRLKDLVDNRLSTARLSAQTLSMIAPPGAETVSQAFAETANASGRAYSTFIDSMIMGVSGYISDLEKARERLLAQEDNTAQAIVAEQDS